MGGEKRVEVFEQFLKPLWQEMVFRSYKEGVGGAAFDQKRFGSKFTSSNDIFDANKKGLYLHER